LPPAAVLDLPGSFLIKETQFVYIADALLINDCIFAASVKIFAAQALVGISHN